MSEPLELTLELGIAEEAPPGHADLITQNLIRELRTLNPESVERVPYRHEKRGTKGGEGLTLTGIVIAILPEVAKKLIEVLFDWVQGDKSRTIKIHTRNGNQRYEITGTWKLADLKDLVDALAQTGKRTSLGRRGGSQ
jgi:hypothetical protein